MQGTKCQGENRLFYHLQNSKTSLQNCFLKNNQIALGLNFKGFRPLRFVYYKKLCTLNKFYSNIKQET